jgi:hypothetical protein
VANNTKNLNQNTTANATKTALTDTKIQSDKNLTKKGTARADSNST